MFLKFGEINPLLIPQLTSGNRIIKKTISNVSYGIFLSPFFLNFNSPNSQIINRHQLFTILKHFKK